MSSLIQGLRGPSVTNQPPTEEDTRRNDIAVIVTVVFALFLALGIRMNALTASKSLSLGDDLPTIQIPANWITRQSDEYLAYAVNPSSPSIFNSELRVTTRALQDTEDLYSARSGLGFKRSQELDRYRELSAESVTVLGNEEAVLVTYAYVEDPTRAAGALAPPVVVQAQDLIFSQDGDLIVITTATDAADWNEESNVFDAVVYSSLRMQEEEGEG